jgi:protein Mpv17
MKSIASPDALPLSTLLFLRGGQQQDEYTASTTEEKDLDSDLKKNYGTQSDEESAGSVEMMKKSSTVQIDSSSVSDAGIWKSRLSMTAVTAPLSVLLQTAATFYTKQLSARPIFTKSATAAIIFGLSDYCAQLIERDEEKKEPIVFSRILTAFLVGLLFFGPAANAWYEMIFKVLPSTSLVSTLKKAALGQIFFGPTFTCVFFGAGMIEAGTFSLAAWGNKIKNDLPAVWASGLGFWPLVDFISYKIVPVQWIPLFVNFCSFVWTIYLSIVANKSKTE